MLHFQDLPAAGEQDQVMAAHQEVHLGLDQPGLTREATDPGLSTASPREAPTLVLQLGLDLGSDQPSDQIHQGDHHRDR